MGEQTGQQLIDAFFRALELMQLDRCQELLQAMEELAQEEPVYQSWCIYFTGILANERHHNWAEGERIFRSLLETDLEPALRRRVLIALGRTYDYLGRWHEALDVYEQCLTVFDQPDQAIDRAKIWKNMAITLEKGSTQGEFGKEALQQAIGYCQLALETLQVLEDPNEDELWLEATMWNTLGLVYHSLGDWPQATRCYERFIALGQTLGSPYDIGAANHNLGEVLQRQGPVKWPEALQAYLKALEIYREFGDRYNEIDLLADLGTLHQEMGEPDRALDDYDQALALAESIRVRLTVPTTQADYRTTIESLYTAPLSLHLQQGDAARAFTAAERARSRVLADLLAGQAARPHAEIPGHLLERRAALRQALDQAYAERPPPADLPHLEESLADLDRQIELLDPAYASLETVASLTAEEVGERLPPESTLLAYAGDADDRLWILVVTAAGVRAEPVKNVSVRWLRGYLARLLDSTRRSSLMPDPQTGHLSPPHLFSPLYQALIAPVWDTLQAAQTVYIVSFGPLHYLPLGALTPNLSTPPPLLAEGRRVVYAPSATILLNYCHARPPSPQQGLLAVAPHDERLQFTLGAAETIARQGGASPLIGPAATRQTFLAQAGCYRVLCFLGHAFFDQRYPMSSRLKLADGSLHASEILRELRLQADLVILSACETGRSRVLRGDEILGLSRAVLYAGTPSLLVTLWPVHEIPTRLLVEELIGHLPLLHPDAPFDPALALAATQRWLRTLSCAEAQVLLAGWGDLSATEVESHLTALRQMTHPGEAPQAESQLFAHPFFWSPYILIGEGRRESMNDQEAL